MNMSIFVLRIQTPSLALFFASLYENKSSYKMSRLRFLVSSVAESFKDLWTTGFHPQGQVRF